MSVEILRASATAGFDVEGAGGSLNLTIENDPGESDGDVIHLLLFPAVGATMRADVGTLSAFGTPRLVDVPGGVVTMQGTTASLPKRADGVPPIIQVLFAFDKSGESITPSILYDTARNLFTSDRECTAAIAYTAYSTVAFPFTYRPELVDAGAGSISKFGTIAAFYPPDNITTFEVSPFSLVNGNSYFEMYRIVSPSITTRDGEFQKPPSFPTSGAYPDKALVLDTGTFLETERVHEVGFMTSTGAVHVQTQFVGRLPPYDSGADAAYKFAKVLKPSSLPVDMFPPDIIKKAQNEIRRRGQGKL